MLFGVDIYVIIPKWHFEEIPNIFFLSFDACSGHPACNDQPTTLHL
jgi:hypothetical protein